MGWAALVLFGLGFIIFSIEFVFLVIARQPLLEVTPEGWRFRSKALFLGVTFMSWQEIGHVGVYQQRAGRSSTSYLVLIRKSEALRAAVAQGAPALYLQEYFARDAQRIPLTFAYFRVTPSACEQLIASIRATCANELAWYDVYVEPKLQRVM
jgi:hypothetical protein